MLTKSLRLIVLTNILFLAGYVLSFANDTKTVTTSQSSNTSTKAMDAPAKNDPTGSSRTNTKAMADSVNQNNQTPQKPKTYSERYRERFQSDTYAQDYKERFKPENYRQNYQRNRGGSSSSRTRIQSLPGEIRSKGPGYDDLTEEQKALYDLEQDGTTEGQRNELENPQLIDESRQTQETAPQPRMNTEHLYRLLQPPSNLARFRAQLNQQTQMSQPPANQSATDPNQTDTAEKASNLDDGGDMDPASLNKTQDETQVTFELDDETSQAKRQEALNAAQQSERFVFTQMRDIDLNLMGNTSQSPRTMLFEEGFNALKFRRYSEAKRVFEQLHQMAPEDHEYQQALGLTSLLLGDHDNAAQWFFMDEPNQDSYPQWLLEAMRSRDVNFQVNRMQFQHDSNEQTQKLLEFIDTLRTY